jgi:hypothetical protein
MTWLVIAAVVLVVVGAAFVALRLVSSSKPMTGSPTPEAARIRIDAVDAVTDTKAEEIKNAPMAQKLDRVRALRDRGRVRRKD